MKYFENVTRDNFHNYYNLIDKIYKNSYNNQENDNIELIGVLKSFMEFANNIPRDEFFQKNIKEYMNLIFEENNTTEEELLKNIIEKQIKFFEKFEDEEKLIKLIIKIYAEKVKFFLKNKLFEKNIPQIVKIIINNNIYLMNSKNFFKIFFDNINPTNLDKLTDVNFYYENICKKLKEKNLNSILLSKIISEIFNDNNELFLKKYFEDENLIKDILTMENNNNNVNNYEE